MESPKSLQSGSTRGKICAAKSVGRCDFCEYRDRASRGRASRGTDSREAANRKRPPAFPWAFAAWRPPSIRDTGRRPASPTRRHCCLLRALREPRAESPCPPSRPPSRPSARHRSQPEPLRFGVERRQIGRQHLLQFVGLHLQLRAEVLEDRFGVRDRLAVAGVDDAEQGGEAVVDLDREVERILAALVPDLVDLLLDRRQVFVSRSAAAFSAASVDLPSALGDLALDAADPDDGVVRFADLVADPQRQRELLLQIGVASPRAAGAS